MLTSKNICLAFGSVFVLVGFLGFVPNPIVSAEGFFETNVLHNLVHVLTGSAFLFGGLAMEGREGSALKVITAAYFGVALLGFVTSGDMPLGLGPYQRSRQMASSRVGDRHVGWGGREFQTATCYSVGLVHPVKRCRWAPGLSRSSMVADESNSFTSSHFRREFHHEHNHKVFRLSHSGEHCAGGLRHSHHPAKAEKGKAPNDLEIAHIAYTAGNIDIRYAHLALAISENPRGQTICGIDGA